MSAWCCGSSTTSTTSCSSLQILAGLPDRPVGVELICVGSFPGRPDFAGLGELEPDELGSLWPGAGAAHERARARRPCGLGRHSAAPIRARSRAMAASPDARLPFLAAALHRLLEELPGARDGLARTERGLLAAIAAGARTREQAFIGAAASEEAPFLGDATAFERLEELAAGSQPLVSRNGELALTAAGADVLAGRADRVALIGFDRWLGGMHLRAEDALWRWDGERDVLVAP